ncbi:MAG: CDP-glucose 4,6-dehydratase [Alphaproteobacteria bacterium]|nr:CDP-glucose 4,6-dehydratase [Alphaproteobacteria bacterium]
MPSLQDSFKGRRVLVTGHPGFKGSWLALWLNELGAEVTGYALAPEYERSHFELLGLEKHIRHIEADIRDTEALGRAFDEAKPEFVFHLAAQALVRRSYDDPLTTFSTNVLGASNVLEEIRNHADIRALIFVTSDKCYLNKEWVWGYRENDELGGHDPYSASKAGAEMAFAAYQHSFFQDREAFGAASVRAGNVIGGGDWAEDRIIPDCIRALEAGNPIKLRNPDATRPWQHVLDPLNGYLTLAAALADKPEDFSGSWNFGPEVGAGLTVGDLGQRAAKLWGGGTVEVDRPEGALFEHRLLQLNIDKVKLELDWHPKWHSERAIGESIDWYKKVIGGKTAWDVSRAQIHAYEDSAGD